MLGRLQETSVRQARRTFQFWIAALLAASCTDRDLPLEPSNPAPEFEIVDAGHNSGNPHFFFLPPMVSQPTLSGTFDGSLSPVVEICRLKGTACAPRLLVRFTTTTGQGGQRIQVDITKQLYIVRWNTERSDAEEGRIYRIRVLVSGTELGHADVIVVKRGKKVKNANTGALIPLAEDRTLPIKFRIEQGAIFVVGPSTQSQTIQTPVTPSGSSVQLSLPPNALTQPMGVTVLPTTTVTNTNGLVGGTAYDFGPTGTMFAAPVTVAIHYDPARIPGGVAEARLQLFTLSNGRWLLVPSSSVNTATHVVTGLTGHFSTYALLGRPAVSAGHDHTCSLTVAGTAYCWGRNNSGQLGDGTTTDRASPVAVTGPDGGAPLIFAMMSAGFGYSCGVTTDGAAYCWGDNRFSELGDGTTSNRMTPTAVTGPGGGTSLTFETVSAGNGHTCGVTTAKAAYCWGYNVDGELGNGIPSDNDAQPVAVEGPGGGPVLNFVTVSAGAHSCGVATDGFTYCWGSNFFGELGVGSPDASPHSTPEHVLGPNFVSVSASREFSACGVATDDAAFCWGRNVFGNLGDGTTSNQSSPQAVGLAVTALSPAGRIGGSFAHTCAVAMADGTTRCWGYNGFGALGDGSRTNRSGPLTIVLGPSFATVSAGFGHSCGVTDTDIYCWGDNSFGELGNGTTVSTVRPVLSGTPAGTPSITFAKLSVGYTHTCGLTAQGAAYCWGSNGSGELGDGTTMDRASPVTVTGPSGGAPLIFAMVSAGFGYTCGVTTDDAAYCWGDNVFSTIGDGTNSNRLTPTAVTGPGGGAPLAFETVSAGNGHACGVTTDKAAYCWGYNVDGQLGNNAPSDNEPSPVAVLGPGGGAPLSFAAVSAGSHSCGITTDGITYCWGENFFGELGIGSADPSPHATPELVSPNFAGASASGGFSTCAVARTDGAAYCWGRNMFGNLGDGTTINQSSPTAVLGVLPFAAVSAGGKVGGGLAHTCGVATGAPLPEQVGAAYCWGLNDFGELGDGTTTNRTSPVAFLFWLKFTTVSAGVQHTCGLTSDGRAYCWGANDRGQLGNGLAGINSPVPSGVGYQP